MEVTVEEQQEVEEEVERLLRGEGEEVKGCDVGLEESKPATLRRSVTYIVCAVIFNEKEEVLMVQEAKPECYKQWYLPAGRVEVGESLEEALKREVKEEAGFDCEPITLLLIQEQGPQWIRFIFLSRITGGAIKTLSAADEESLQASWWDRQSVLPLRGRDILHLIHSGLTYRQDPQHPVTLPLDLSCRHVVQRLVLVFIGAEEQVFVLLVRGPTPRLPVAAALRTHAVTWGANMVVQEAMASSYYDYELNTLGVLSLQHHGRVHGLSDGVCFNTLAVLVPDPVQRDEDGLKLEWTPRGTPPPVENPRYVWFRVRTPALREKLLQKTRNSTVVPISSLY
ncbi:8-oxo-dGDP phosphatase NUDT18 isoform X2 [Mugil cephalus]|nr:8-oxo-dGDP phosphatase NUDT18 isoform X2 [Mugil cephalus]XP_047448136.1 8-oxo-dGDP phosphatase NUDT18 isoform X2 [Mugil cephalus]